MENKFFLENMVEKLEKGKNSFFLDPKEQKQVASLLKKKGISYSIYEPYPGAEKVLFYEGKFPDIELLEIVSKIPLEHRSILGVLFAHHILPYFYSDIMITDTCYLVVLKPIAIYLQDHVHEIGKNPVQIVKRNLKLLTRFEPQFDTLILHVSSLRIDTIMAKIMSVSRTKVEEKLKDKEVMVNYQNVTKKDMLLNLQDVFSIRGYGKYILKDIVYQNKKGHMDLEILKYK